MPVIFGIIRICCIFKVARCIKYNEYSSGIYGITLYGDGKWNLFKIQYSNEKNGCEIPIDRINDETCEWKS